jgi:hypothetical protein
MIIIYKYSLKYLKHFAPIILLLSLTCCSTFKQEMKQSGGQDEAVKNAIIDFSNSSKFFKRSTVFVAYVKNPFYRAKLVRIDERNSEWVNGELYNHIIGISMSEYRKAPPLDSTMIGKKVQGIPTRFWEKDDKLFLWFGNNYILTEELYALFKKYDLLLENTFDGMVEYFEPSENSPMKGVDYFFCKNDLRKYKKVTTSKAIGYYDIPTLNCE